jgi:hypothetical protein
MIAAVLLYVLPPQLSVQGLLHSIGCVLPLHYFSSSMNDLQVDLVVLEQLLQKHCPSEHTHLQSLGLPSSSYCTQMLLQGFVPFCSPALLLRLWDALLFASFVAGERHPARDTRPCITPPQTRLHPAKMYKKKAIGCNRAIFFCVHACAW